MNSLEVRLLGLCALTVKDPGSTPDLGTKITQGMGCCPPKKRKEKKHETKQKQTK